MGWRNRERAKKNLELSIPAVCFVELHSFVDKHQTLELHLFMDEGSKKLDIEEQMSAYDGHQ